MAVFSVANLDKINLTTSLVILEMACQVDALLVLRNHAPARLLKGMRLHAVECGSLMPLGDQARARSIL
ncbi:MAG: hypothetical protein D6791_05605 [Chloroflexi bacterium]|nr:MAG: hypothetical protein D6791_05605 [Chloroflexota bacterium]